MTDGPKMVTCAVCGQQVSKRQTLQRSDGSRACRTHEGITDESKARLDKERAVKEQAIKDAEARHKHAHSDSNAVMTPRCWCCRRAGMRQDEFFTRMLINSEKFSISYGKSPNMFDGKDTAEVMAGLTMCLWILPVNDGNKARVKAAIWQELKMLLDITNLILICQECADKHKISIPNPALNAKQLLNLSVLYETTVKPVIRDIAGSELARTN